MGLNKLSGIFSVLVSVKAKNRDFFHEATFQPGVPSYVKRIHIPGDNLHIFCLSPF